MVVCKDFAYENPFGAITDLHIICLMLAPCVASVNTVPDCLANLASIQDRWLYHRGRFQIDRSNSVISL